MRITRYSIEYWWSNFKSIFAKRSNVDIDTIDSGCCLDCASEDLDIDYGTLWRRLYSSSTKQWYRCYGHLCKICSKRRRPVYYERY